MASKHAFVASAKAGAVQVLIPVESHCVCRDPVSLDLMSFERIEPHLCVLIRQVVDVSNPVALKHVGTLDVGANLAQYCERAPSRCRLTHPPLTQSMRPVFCAQAQ